MYVYLVEKANFNLIEQMARDIWPVCYGEILSERQIDYMLDQMYSPQTLQKVNKEGQLFYLFELNDEMVGFVGIQEGKPTQHDLRLHKIYLKPEFHGLGYGKEMLRFVEQLASEKKMTRIHLNVNKMNNAVHFYLNNGFERIGEEKIDIGSGYYMDDFVLIKDLQIVG